MPFNHHIRYSLTPAVPSYQDKKFTADSRPSRILYDIGTKILCKTCFGHNSTQNERKSKIFSGCFTEFSVHYESAIKTRLKAFFKNQHPWIRNYRFRNSSFLPPAGILREPFYKIVKIVVASIASCRVVSSFFYKIYTVHKFYIFYIFRPTRRDRRDNATTILTIL